MQQSPIVNLRFFTYMIVGFLLLLGSAEVCSRYILGLGDPPLVIVDNEIEYYFSPGHYNRFGNEIFYNSKSMRSTEPPPPNDRGKNILVIGDSVINGGALTDQKDLATELVKSELGPQYWVGNISAGSWGPANIHAYLSRFGWFDADVAIFVFSTHDISDLPDYRNSYGVDFPTQAPVSAFLEMITRYLPRFFPSLRTYLQSSAGEPSVEYDEADRNKLGAERLKSLLNEASQKVNRVIVLLHPTKSESQTPKSAERRLLYDSAKSSNAIVYDLLDARLLKATDYRDDIHLNTDGQRVYSHIFSCLIVKAPVETCSPFF